MWGAAFLYLAILYSLIVDLLTHSVGILIPYYVLNHVLDAGHTDNTHHPFNWLHREREPK